MPDSVFPITISVPAEAAGQRLDQFLTAQLPDTSRARAQQLLEEAKALVNSAQCKPSLKLKGGETITILGDSAPPPLRAIAEDIPLDIIYEDADLAVVNKPAGMMVHAGAGATDDARNRGTLVNALLHRFAQLSEVGGETRPGIVHRLDKDTSGLILIARNDEVQERIESPYGKFALLDVHIETGRTHQIRVHMASIGHPVVGDTLYGAPAVLRSAAAPRKASRKTAQAASSEPQPPALTLDRNFLHAAAIEFAHPRTGKPLSLAAPLPEELIAFLDKLRTPQQL